LRGTANEAGLSLNAFAVQVLAAAAGDPARFRLPIPEPPTLRELERDRRGYPLGWRERDTHIGARNQFIVAMLDEMGSAETWPLVKKYDTEDPAYFVEWQAARANRAG
jgi:hypothetical protein